MFRLDGKVAFVTGSTRGLGWAIAEAMAAQGAHVVINGRSDHDVRARVRELIGRGHSADGRSGDVGDLEAAAADIDRIAEAAGRFDILVNNAGINVRAPLEEFDQADWDRVLRVNLDAPFALSRAASRHMRGAG